MNKKLVEKQIKFAIIGNSGVGSQSIMSRYCNKPKAEGTSIRPDYVFTNTQIDDLDLKLVFWFTQHYNEQQSRLKNKCFEHALGLIYIYDITDRSSYDKCVNEINNIPEISSNLVSKLLIGNKSDLSNQRQVSTEEAQTLAQHNGMLFFETSATENINVGHSIGALLIRVMERGLNNIDSQTNKKGIDLCPRTRDPYAQQQNKCY